MEQGEKYPAEYRIHTIQGPLYCCERHMNAAIKIFGALGVMTGAPDIVEGHECSNCINEAKRKANA